MGKEHGCEVFRANQAAVAAGSPTVVLRPEIECDREFLLGLYASTRAEEKALLGWPEPRWDEFIRMQFTLQHTQYRHNYRRGSFEIILVEGAPAGRFYLERGETETRVIDLALLPQYRRRGIGTTLLRTLLREAAAEGRAVSLHVERNNPVLDFYHGLGFRLAEDKGVYLLMVCPPPPETPALHDEFSNPEEE